MKDSLVTTLEPGAAAPVTIRLLDNVTFLRSLQFAGPFATSWFDTYGFRAHHGEIAKMPAEDGTLREVIVGQGQNADDPSVLACAARSLRTGLYEMDTQGFSKDFLENAALFWAMENYRFERYKAPDIRSLPWQPPRLLLPKDADADILMALCDAITLVRNLVNTPAGDLGPEELADAARDLARNFGAEISVIEGDALLEHNFPLIHAVGRASPRAPRLIELRWGEKHHPAVTLVGKGVCFDTGGLDIKPSSNMLLMKKDMAGAAHALALGHLVMTLGLPVRLRILIGAVDNAISGDALRPGDVVRSRKGLFVEIGNTDAEGRLVLADLLARACEEPPRLLLDFATLTGAARVALGPDLPALFSNNDTLADRLVQDGRATFDPLWRLPLWSDYRTMLESPVADLTNSPESGFAGAIAAALFLREFVNPLISWAHIDLFAWQSKAAPGHPRGGKAQTLRPALEAIRAVSENPETFAET